MKRFTKEEDDFLRANYLTVPCKRMATMLGRAESTARQRLALLGIKIPAEVSERFKMESRIKKGNVPPNKGRKMTEWMSKESIKRSAATRFKKGQKIHNEKYDGAITIRYDHKDRKGRVYKWIRIKKGKWKQYSHYRWEKFRGKVPRGKILAFKNGDTLDCRLSNLVLMDRQKNMQRNSYHNNYPKEIAQVIQLRGALTRQINKHAKQNQ